MIGSMERRIHAVNTYRDLKRLYERYERALIPGMLVFGVIVDFVTFRSIRIGTAFALLVAYFIIAGATIAFLNLYDSRKASLDVAVLRYLRLSAPLAIQFTFGALLSASLIFYWFSGALSVSWPLIGIIAILMTSNEVFRHYYLKPVVQMSVYFFILFSLLTLMLPFAFNSVSAWLFAAGGVMSLLLTLVYVHALSRVVPEVRRERKRIAGAVLSVFFFMNMLYALNVIPPIPLSIREAGAYHGITRIGGTYTLLSEKETFLDGVMPGQVIHVAAGGTVAVYTSVFAPAELKTNIVHRWEYYDDDTWKWLPSDRFVFPIIGGRDDGYRGFSIKNNVRDGRWRVNVETVRGQVLGRVTFRIESVAERPELIEITKQ